MLKPVKISFVEKISIIVVILKQETFLLYNSNIKK